MSTLEKRATARQMRIFRAVAGAVKNTADAHPEWPVDRKMIKSIAKRATGTLSAQFVEVLAAPSVSSEQPASQIDKKSAPAPSNKRP